MSEASSLSIATQSVTEGSPVFRREA